MATKTVITRIKNKVDTLSAWQSYTGTLLDGEIAVVRVPTGTSYTNPVTGKTEPVVELLMKVGDGTSSFADLKWMSAKASDVYDWAKAATVEFDTVNYKIKFKDASGAVITKADIDLSDIDSRLTALEGKKLTVTPNDTSKPGVVQSVAQGTNSHELSVTYGLVQTADIADSAVTTAKIANSNVTTAKIADSNVTTAKIANGAITNDKIGTDVSTDKIVVGSGTTSGTLSAKISSMDSAILANTNKLAGHTDAAINTLITNKINDLDVSAPDASGTGTAFITSVSQSNGKISATKANLPSASSSTAGIAKLGATGGAATYDSIFGSDGKGGINKQVELNAAAITSLQNAVAGGVHFIGTTTTNVTTDANKTSKNVTINSETVAANQGDIVIYSTREFIWTGAAWEELGDVTRIGNLETKINNLDYNPTTLPAGAATNSKFVTKVTQTDGKIAVTYARPSAADISYESSDVDTALDSHASKILAVENKLDGVTTVTTYVSNAIDSALDALDVTAPSASGNATSFITSVSQSNGKISATKATVPNASTSTAGIVKLAGSGSATTAAKSDHTHSGYEGQLTALETNFVRYDATSKHMYVGLNGTEEIIFDCGGAN